MALRITSPFALLLDEMLQYVICFEFRKTEKIMWKCLRWWKQSQRGWGLYELSKNVGISATISSISKLLKAFFIRKWVRRSSPGNGPCGTNKLVECPTSRPRNSSRAHYQSLTGSPAGLLLVILVDSIAKPTTFRKYVFIFNNWIFCNSNYKLLGSGMRFDMKYARSAISEQFSVQIFSSFLLSLSIKICLITQLNNELVFKAFEFHKKVFPSSFCFCGFT